MRTAWLRPEVIMDQSLCGEPVEQKAKTLGYHGANWAKIMVLATQNLNDTRVVGADCTKELLLRLIKSLGCQAMIIISKESIVYSLGNGEKFFQPPMIPAAALKR